MRQDYEEQFLPGALEAIYDAALDPLQWPRALGAIADCFGDVGTVLLWRRDDGAFGTIVSENLAIAQKEYEEDGWGRKDIKALRAEERGYFFSGEPCTDRHVCSEEEIEHHPFYRDFLRPRGMGWVGAIAVSPDPHVGVILCVQRDASRKPQYSDAELEALRTIARHVERSLRLSVRLLNAELVNLGLGEALARIGMGVFALDSLARVVFSNPAGQQMLGDALDIVDGRLQIGRGEFRNRLDEAIVDLISAAPEDLTADPKPILVESAASDRRLVIYLLPVRQPSVAEQFLTQTRAIVLVMEQKLDEPADPAVVRDLLGLTLGEARIAAMVGSGLPPRDAATRLGITEETARNVLKRVFAKVGVSRQSELVALLSKLVLR